MALSAAVIVNSVHWYTITMDIHRDLRRSLTPFEIAALLYLHLKAFDPTFEPTLKEE